MGNFLIYTACFMIVAFAFVMALPLLIILCLLYGIGMLFAILV